MPTEKESLSRDKGVLIENSAGIGPVTREMVHARAKELSLIAGHNPAHVTQSAYEQAKRELTGETDTDRQDAVLESLPEACRGDPGAAGDGQPEPESADGNEEEDDEGRGPTERLVDEGSAEAGIDRSVQAARATRARDRLDAAP